jgi:UDP-N-acetylmuramoylalanine--D-glutamate ligase
VRVTESSDKKEALENASYLRALGIEVETGGHTEAFIEGSAMVVTSPGVPKTSLPLQWAAQRGLSVISEIELASHFCKGRVIAVTGSNGKTTTCHLIHRVFAGAGRHSVLCGNVGFSFLDAIPEIRRGTIVVLELSSFQLEDSPSFRPRVAVVLNVSPNHLDRHGTFEAYAAAKENIFKNQKPRDTLILNADDARVRVMAEKARASCVFFSKRPLKEGIFLREGSVVSRQGIKEEDLFDTRTLQLQGEHNLENVMACTAVAQVLRVPKKKLERSLAAIRTLEHRIEPLGEIGGVQFVNDSKSTTVQSTAAAIRAMDRPVVLVAGGRDKGVSFSEIEPVLKERVKAAVLYGEARQKIAGAWQGFSAVSQEAAFADAVRAAFRQASAGDCVLLSPMCTSFDQFSSYEQRGEAFKRCFRELRGQA